VEGREQFKENLVLVGSSDYDYVESLRAFIRNKQSVWSSWNFRIREEWRSTISDRIKSHGKFPLFFYLSKKLGGSGTIEFVGLVSDIVMSDTPAETPAREFTRPGEENFPSEEFKSYTWFKFSAIDPFGPIYLDSFRDVYTEAPLNPSQLIASFAYAFLPEDFEESAAQEQAAEVASITVERDLRKYLVLNLESLEPGLTITGEEYPTEGGRMRIDILAKDASGGFVVIELKAGVADISTFGQISAYVGWVKQNLARSGNVRGIIVANDFDERMRYAVESSPHIKLKQYKLEFQFRDIK